MNVVRFVQFIAIFMLVLAQVSVAYASSEPVDKGWEYRWGDSSFDASGVPEWARNSQPDQWHGIGFPSNPPGRNGREQVWYRVTLPVGEFQEPVLYIYSVDIIFQVYLEGEKIYQYGAFDDQGRGRFEGWPWHAISLPEDYENKTIYFRVFSDYTDIGLWGEVSVMDEPDLLLYILGNSMESLVVAAFSSLIALLALVFALLQTEKKSFASIALFTLSSSIMLLSESQASLLIWYKPLLWDYLAAGSYYMVPVAMALLLEQWLAHEKPWLINLVWKVHLVYLVGAIGSALTGVIDLSSTFPPFDALFLTSLLSMAVVALLRFRHLLREQQVLLLAYGVFSSLLVADMAVAHGFLPWGRVPVNYGMLLFSVSVVAISLWHYASTQQALQRMNVSLEQKVAERTARAESLARREQARVRMLTFENEKSRILGDIIAELQDCLGQTQAFQVVTKMMPELCSPLRGAFYRRVSDSRYERVAEWGTGTKSKILPLVLDVASGLPEPSKLPARSGLLDDGAESTGEASMCFWVNVESAEGIVTEAVLLLENDVGLMTGVGQYGSARLFSSLNQAIQRVSITLSSIALREELQKFSYEDSLTGLKNRRYFDQLFQHESLVAQRKELSLALLVLDIDHFKTFNDRYGHEAGDRALQVVASVLQAQFRESDIVCRYGGEEFVVIMPGAATTDAVERARHFREAVRRMPVVHHGRSIGHLTVSVGVASWPDCGESPSQLLGLADQALYEAKAAGRDRVMNYGESDNQHRTLGT
ncbi:diguanylate cyclase [Marinobacter salinexigens]|uniref:diguanylate cyclase n=1 Tax=Marinobacter salinexigens TaxID=2919747 RepID=A0A5B0VIJ7_9GAMM|nr:GGDEF domain-containing protein [Marinobacter salinexigens]KAA1174426.1 diguanylate cyclase [Marinobacter salinexigens]